MSGSTPRTAVISFRDVRHGPWNVHGFALTDLVATAFDATTLTVQDPTSPSHRFLVGTNKRLDLVRKLPGRSRLSPTAGEVGPLDLLFVVAHDATDLDQLFASEPDWVDSATTKILLLVEVWAADARRWPGSYARVLPHFDAVFCTLEEGIGALSEASGTHVEVIGQGVDVLATPFHPEPRLDVLTIGRRAPAQHDLLGRWADEREGWYQYDTLPAGRVADIDLHRKVTAEMLSWSAVSICNYARFDDTERIGTTKGTGTRFFETVASGALIAGELPTDQMFTDEFGAAPGVAELPIDCSHLGLEAIDELVAKGRDRATRAGNRAHALGQVDLAHRLRQVLARVDIAEPPVLTERFAALDDARAALAPILGGP